ncbi:MAG TPA: hypothetical protein VE870_04200 [Bacteroidales bacterium]|nr:hypothetical protein [Bacteroidales bacterium]
MKHTLTWVSIFAIAMGFFEAAVVIYLRSIMYPAGFAFPLAPIAQGLAVTEILREAATLIMLLSVGIIAGRNISERFAWFIYSFAIWDIFYYVFLRLLIGWPPSLMTWDILFLIPVTWVGPVITPVIVSLSMLLLAGVIIFYSAKGIRVVIKGAEWSGLIAGSLILILAFIWDYSSFILSRYTLREIFNLPNNKPLYDLAMTYIPSSFNWFLFSTGQVVILITILLMARRLNRIIKMPTAG